MAKIWIKNGRVWNGEEFLQADILTDGKVIAKIGTIDSAPADFIYDAAGKTVSAGLVDLHVHMKGIASDRFGIEPHMSSFPFGVTAVNDAGSVRGDEDLLNTFSVKNTVFIGSRMEDNHFDPAFSDSLLKTYGEKVIGIKMYFDATLSEVQDLTPLKELTAYAREKGLKVMVHCSHSPCPMTEIIDSFSAGDILTHIYHGGEHSCVEEHFKAFALAKKKGVIMDAGFAGFVHTDFALFQEAIQRGFLPDTISTDITKLSAFQRGGRYGMPLCMSMAKAAGMREETILKAVTSAPAKALGKEGEWGYLKEGRAADFAVLDFVDEGFDLTDPAGNRFRSDAGYRCLLTVCDGQIVYKD